MSNKWEAAPKSIKDVYSAINELYDIFNIEPELLDKVLDDYNELEAKHHKALEAISRCKDEIDDKDKLIEELKQKVDTLESQNRKLKYKIRTNSMFGINGKFEKNIGERVADSIREACEKDVCKLSPYTRIDIHVEQTNDVLMTFGRYAFPRIVVMFNNTQTEMERDTAQHECEELNEKIDSLWSVNEELNRKIKALEKENKGLKRTIAWFNEYI